ncbi:hypothetical protein DRH27_04000 [Candidatus Falkowbacteria bacterium]|nr:MAG: hypothetical protein DRH27_04000 [Candidatus Falkowbacteria bacterium]
MNNNKTLKICVSSEGKTLNSEIDPRFGRCKYFLIVDIKGGNITNVGAITNKGADMDRGAGISAAGQVGELKADLVISGDIGPKAKEVLKQLNIKIYKKTGLIKSAINDYIKNPKNNSDSIPAGISSQNLIKPNNKEKIFIPLADSNGEDSQISLHFGRALYYGLYETTENKLIIKKISLDHNNPDKTPVEQIIDIANPTTVYALDMGPKAVKLFKEKNIKLKTGSYKILKKVIKNLENLENLEGDCGH